MRIFRVLFFVVATSTAAFCSPGGILENVRKTQVDPTHEAVGFAFRVLLNNAVEWGGRLDPNQKVRISCVRIPRALIYRIDDPKPGFRLEELKHAAINNPEDDPLTHTQVREEKGLRPGGVGLMMTKAMIDELVYNEARNQVVLIKYL
jgi:hypothetical protein